MDNQILVSVVLPIYNVEKYLDRCIKSIINQTYKNLEIILVDDGSPDRCPEICDEWTLKDTRIKVIHKQNAGLGMARNTGMDNAAGDYICFIDSDDYIDADAIEVCANRILHDNPDIALYGSRCIDRDGSIKSEISPHCPEAFYKGKAVQEVFLPQLISPLKGDWGIRMSAWCCLYNMKLLHRAHFRFVSEREIISEDVYSLLKLYKAVDSVSLINKALYNYCVNETSLTHTYRTDRYEKIRMFYHECLKLIDVLEYNSDVRRAMQGPYFSNTIAAVKMIVRADEKIGAKMNYLKHIVEDSTLQELLRSDDLWIANNKKRILFWMIKNKVTPMVYVLACLK